MARPRSHSRSRQIPASAASRLDLFPFHHIVVIMWLLICTQQTSAATSLRVLSDVTEATNAKGVEIDPSLDSGLTIERCTFLSLQISVKAGVKVPPSFLVTIKDTTILTTTSIKVAIDATASTAGRGGGIHIESSTLKGILTVAAHIVGDGTSLSVKDSTITTLSIKSLNHGDPCFGSGSTLQMEGNVINQGLQIYSCPMTEMKMIVKRNVIRSVLKQKCSVGSPCGVRAIEMSGHSTIANSSVECADNIISSDWADALVMIQNSQLVNSSVTFHNNSFSAAARHASLRMFYGDDARFLMDDQNVLNEDVDIQFNGGLDDSRFSLNNSPTLKNINLVFGGNIINSQLNFTGSQCQTLTLSAADQYVVDSTIAFHDLNVTGGTTVRFVAAGLNRSHVEVASMRSEVRDNDFTFDSYQGSRMVVSQGTTFTTPLSLNGHRHEGTELSIEDSGFNMLTISGGFTAATMALQRSTLLRLFVYNCRFQRSDALIAWNTIHTTTQGPCSSTFACDARSFEFTRTWLVNSTMLIAHNMFWADYEDVVNIPQDSSIADALVSFSNNTLAAHNIRKTALRISFGAAGRLAMDALNRIDGHVSLSFEKGMVNSTLLFHDCNSIDVFTLAVSGGDVENSTLNLTQGMASSLTVNAAEDIKGSFIAIRDFVVGSAKSQVTAKWLDDTHLLLQNVTLTSFTGNELKYNSKGRSSTTVSNCTFTTTLTITGHHTENSLVLLEQSILSFVTVNGLFQGFLVSTLIVRNCQSDHVLFFATPFIGSTATFEDNVIYAASRTTCRSPATNCNSRAFELSGGSTFSNNSMLTLSGNTFRSDYADAINLASGGTFENASAAFKNNTAVAGQLRTAFRFHGTVSTHLLVDTQNTFIGSIEIDFAKGMHNSSVDLNGGKSHKIYVTVAGNVSNTTLSLSNGVAEVVSLSASGSIVDSSIMMHSFTCGPRSLQLSAQWLDRSVIHLLNTTSTTVAMSNSFNYGSVGSSTTLLENSSFDGAVEWTGHQTGGSAFLLQDCIFKGNCKFLGQNSALGFSEATVEVQRSQLLQGLAFVICPLHNASVSVRDSIVSVSAQSTRCGSIAAYCANRALQFDGYSVAVDSRLMLLNTSMRSVYKDAFFMSSSFVRTQVVMMNNAFLAGSSHHMAIRIMMEEGSELMFDETNKVHVGIVSVTLKETKASSFALCGFTASTSRIELALHHLQEQSTFLLCNGHVSGKIILISTNATAELVLSRVSTRELDVNAYGVTDSPTIRTNRQYRPPSHLRVEQSKFDYFMSVECDLGMSLYIDPRTRIPNMNLFRGCVVDELLALYNHWPLIPLSSDDTPPPRQIVTQMSLHKCIVLPHARIDFNGLQFSTTDIYLGRMTFHPHSSIYFTDVLTTTSVTLPSATVNGATVCMDKLTMSGSGATFKLYTAANSFSNSLLLAKATAMHGVLKNVLNIPATNSTFVFANLTASSSLELYIKDSSKVVIGGKSQMSSLQVMGPEGGDDTCSFISSSELTTSRKKVENLGSVEELPGEVPDEYINLINERCTPLVLPATQTPSVPATPSRSLSQQPPHKTNTVTLAEGPSTPTPTAAVSPSIAREPTPTVESAPTVPSTATIAMSLDATATATLNLPPPTQSTIVETSAPPTAHTDSPSTPSPPPVNVSTEAPVEPAVERQREAKRSLMVTVVLGGNEEAGEAVAASSVSAMAVSAAMTPTAATQLSRVAAAAQAINCVVDPDDDRPSSFELPLQPAVGSGHLRYYAGGVLMGGVVVFVVTLILLLLRHKSQREWHQKQNLDDLSSGNENRSPSSKQATTGTVKMLHFFGIVYAVFLLYLAPNIVGGVVFIVLHGSTMEGAVGMAALGLLLFAVGVVAFMLTKRFGATQSVELKRDSPHASSSDHNDPQDSDEEEGSSDRTTTSSSSAKSSSTSSSSEQHRSNTTSKIEFQDEVQGSFFVLSFQAMFDGTTDSTKLMKRLYALEELLSASAMAGIAGTRPGAGHCSKVSGALLLVAMLHLGYVLWFRPLRTRLDHFFSVFFAVVQLVMSIACVAATRIIETDGEESASTPLEVVSGTVLVMFAGFFVQVFVQGYWAYHTHSRRKLRERTQDEGVHVNFDDSQQELEEMPKRKTKPKMARADDGDGILSVPLVARHQIDDTEGDAGPQVANPLYDEHNYN